MSIKITNMKIDYNDPLNVISLISFYKGISDNIKNKEKKSILDRIKLFYYRKINTRMLQTVIDNALENYIESTADTKESYDTITNFLNMLYTFYIENPDQYENINDIAQVAKTVSNTNFINITTDIDKEEKQTRVLKKYHIVIKDNKFPMNKYKNGRDIFENSTDKFYKIKMDIYLEARIIDASISIYDCDNEDDTKTARILYNNKYLLSDGKLENPNYEAAFSNDIFAAINTAEFSVVCSILINIFIQYFSFVTGYLLHEIKK